MTWPEPVPLSPSVTTSRHNLRPYDRDHDRERRHRDERDSYRDRDRDYEGDRDHRRRKIDEIDEASPHPSERSMKHARRDEVNGNASPMDVEPMTKASSVCERSMESDHCSSTRRSDDGRHGSLPYKLPVDDRSPPDRKNAFLIYSLVRLSCHFSSRQPSPSYENGPPPRSPNDDSEARSVFVSQLAACCQGSRLFL